MVFAYHDLDVFWADVLGETIHGPRSDFEVWRPRSSGWEQRSVTSYVRLNPWDGHLFCRKVGVTVLHGFEQRLRLPDVHGEVIELLWRQGPAAPPNARTLPHLISGFNDI